MQKIIVVTFPHLNHFQHLVNNNENIYKHNVSDIIDDLLATGGTACGAALLLQKLDVNVAGFAFVISLEFLKGRQKLVEYSNNIITLKEY